VDRIQQIKNSTRNFSKLHTPPTLEIDFTTPWATADLMKIDDEFKNIYLELGAEI
jgi:hypothetical protein